MSQESRGSFKHERVNGVIHPHMFPNKVSLKGPPPDSQYISYQFHSLPVSGDPDVWTE